MQPIAHKCFSITVASLVARPKQPHRGSFSSITLILESDPRWGCSDLILESYPRWGCSGLILESDPRWGLILESDPRWGCLGLILESDPRLFGSDTGKRSSLGSDTGKRSSLVRV